VDVDIEMRWLAVGLRDVPEESRLCVQAQVSSECGSLLPNRSPWHHILSIDEDIIPAFIL
jgi:hypothetical protein